MKTTSILLFILIATYQSHSQIYSPWSKVDTVTSGDCEDIDPVLVHGTLLSGFDQSFQLMVFARNSNTGSLIIGKKFFLNASTWDSTLVTISATDNNRPQRKPDLTEISYFGSGNVQHRVSIVAWELNEDSVWNIYFSRLSDSDSAWSPAEPLTHDSVNNTDAQVRPLSDSTSIIIWKRKQVLLYSLINPVAISPPETIAVSTVDSLEFDVATGYGNSYVVWTSQDTTGKNLMISRQLLTYPAFSLAAPETLFFRKSAFNPRIINSPVYSSGFVLFETELNGNRDIFAWQGYPGSSHSVQNITNDSLADDRNPRIFVNPVITKPDLGKVQAPTLYYGELIFERDTRSDSSLVFIAYSSIDTVKSVGYNRNVCIGQNFFSNGLHILSVWESNRSGHSHIYGRITSIFSGEVENGSDAVTSFELQQNYPNPFNPATNFQFTVPKSGIVTLTIYDLLGRKVAIVVNEKLTAGTYRRQWNAAGYASGIYFYRLQSAGFIQTRKLILLK